MCGIAGSKRDAAKPKRSIPLISKPRSLDRGGRVARRVTAAGDRRPQAAAVREPH
jgi:hypothetical protein